MKAVIGQFYKTLNQAIKHAEELKRMWQGEIAFVIVGNNKGYLVISETAARSCGLEIPYNARRYLK